MTVKRLVGIALICWLTLLACRAQSSAWIGYVSTTSGYRITCDAGVYKLWSVDGQYLVGIPIAWNTKGTAIKWRYTSTAPQLLSYLGVP